MSYYPDLSAYYAAAAANQFTAAAAVRLAAASPPMKRQRVMVPPQGAPIGSQRSTVIAKPPSTPPARKPQGNICLEELKSYCTGPDILICGNCRGVFRCLSDLLHHKRDYCKLRFACKCSHDAHQMPTVTDEVGSVLLCGLCSESFMTAGLLLEHFQSTHSVEIYKVENDEDSGDGEHHCGSNGTDSAGSEQADQDTAARAGSPQTDSETGDPTDS